MKINQDLFKLQVKIVSEALMFMFTNTVVEKNIF